jgi:hypothetical protein
MNALFGYWPTTYAIYNSFFILCLFWAIHCKDSIEAMYAVLFIDISSIFLDLGCIIGYFTYAGVWSVIFAIINFACRPVSIIFLHKELKDRGGEFEIITIPRNNPNPRSYEDMDRNNPQSIPTSNSGHQNISNLF